MVTSHDNTPSKQELGIIVVDHGSRRAQSNEMLLEVVAMFEKNSDYPIIEPAHMELAEPSIATAFERCVQRGAKMVIVHPYFLLPGRHWHTDIPELTAEAAKHHPGVPFLVTAPLGLHPLMANVMNERIEHCLECAQGEGEPCPICQQIPDAEGCQFKEVAVDGAKGSDEP